MEIFALLFLLLALTKGYPNTEQCEMQVRNGGWHQIRIGHDFTGFENIAEEKLQIFHTAVDNAISYWSRTLRVRQSVMPGLYYQRPCEIKIGGYCMRAAANKVDSPSHRYEPEVMDSLSEVSYPFDEETFMKISPFDIDRLDTMICSDDALAETCRLETMPAGIGSGRFQGTDLHLHFIHDTRKGYGTLASAQSFGLDECGRSTIAVIFVSDLLLQKDGVEVTTVLLHELVHVFGFTTDTMNEWVSPTSGQLLLPRGNHFQLRFWAKNKEIAVLEGSGLAPMSWDIYRVETVKLFTSIAELEEESTTDEHFYQVPVPHHVISKLNVRLNERRRISTATTNNQSSVSSQCTCPTSLNEKFTEEDLVNCINYSNRCTFIVNSEQVRATTRQYYNCETAPGMELENEREPSVYFINSHWKTRNLRHELMNWKRLESNGGISFISPMTLGLISGTGQYDIDYDFGLTKLVPGIHWGYQDGCGLLDNWFVYERVVPTKLQAKRGEPGNPALYYLLLPNTSKEFNGIELMDFRYEYGKLMSECSSSTFSQFSRPSYTIHDEKVYNDGDGLVLDGKGLSCLSPQAASYHKRCIDNRWVEGYSSFGGGGVCVEVTCNKHLTAYSFEVPPPTRKSSKQAKIQKFVCRAKDQILTVAEGSNMTYICADPAIVCAQLHYPHYPPELGINRPPGWEIGQVVSSEPEAELASETDINLLVDDNEDQSDDSDID